MAEHAAAELARAPGGPEGDEPGQRGSLEVRDRVVERLAQRAALDTPGVTPRGAKLAGLSGRELPRVQVQVKGGRVRAAVELAVAWPTPCTTVAAAVRSEVTTVLRDLAGLGVDAVDVTVSTVLTADQVPTPPRRLL